MSALHEIFYYLQATANITSPEHHISGRLPATGVGDHTEFSAGFTCIFFTGNNTFSGKICALDVTTPEKEGFAISNWDLDGIADEEEEEELTVVAEEGGGEEPWLKKLVMREQNSDKRIEVHLLLSKFALP
ncbi:hypothetical protein BDK51DRAFT_29847 [Blyttiomyces helicus]|uniref:Uncharacterized protein n=1 Tax=Blyttiomyces helicus TaxID=388810 RepID=A0A4P9WMX2_9FUNG|nr:hypothetical protein BDK51DRAFT_29847 [Blyttiomyces helicus]|eukprot:RKO94441.1 hypothetical protein BDK51DRAFT_29847 [Blyttiomyces helicus]